ncbi:hypothetical protein V2J09_010708 [Rumex salicifolius]
MAFWIGLKFEEILGDRHKRVMRNESGLSLKDRVDDLVVFLKCRPCSVVMVGAALIATGRSSFNVKR